MSVPKSRAEINSEPGTDLIIGASTSLCWCLIHSVPNDHEAFLPRHSADPHSSYIPSPSHLSPRSTSVVRSMREEPSRSMKKSLWGPSWRGYIPDEKSAKILCHAAIKGHVPLLLASKVDKMEKKRVAVPGWVWVFNRAQCRRWYDTLKWEQARNSGPWSISVESPHSSSTLYSFPQPLMRLMITFSIPSLTTEPTFITMVQYQYRSGEGLPLRRVADDPALKVFHQRYGEWENQYITKCQNGQTTQRTNG
ncbi:hypothetical protein BT69DRAFT_1343508 [Atractiella rhizophila]|nr:hypothetical protein BT69DRAFT_1343508 [Atractiella rhizophila]